MQRYTTSSLGTLFRGAARAVKAVRLRPLPWAVHLAHWRLALHSTLRNTATHAPRLQPTPQYARLNRYPAFRSSTRPSIPRIPAGHQVGLGSARNFSSGPAAKTAHNVPIVLRAFTHIFDDDEYKQLPTARRYVPYPPPRRQQPRRTARHVRRCSDTHSNLLADLAHFFPARGPLILPPTPETLITPGLESTLSLPLAPGLDDLLALPTPSVSYADAEVGSAVLSSLLPLGDAISLASARVLPLLARLENLGVLEETSWPRTRLQVEMRDGRPDILRVVFESRSEDDVITLLGAMGKEETEHGKVTASWFVIQEKCSLPETEEQWERVPRSADRGAGGAVGLIMPAIQCDLEDIPSPMPSGTTTPSSLLESWDDNASFLLDLSAVSSASDWSGSESDLSLMLAPASEWSTSSLASGVMDAADMWLAQRWTVEPTAGDLDAQSVENEIRYDRALFVSPW